MKQEQKTVPPYKHTKCVSCGTQDKPLFAMPRMKDANDFVCEDCKVQELERRTKQ